MRSKHVRIMIVTVASAMLLGLAGCDWLLGGTNAASFAAGYLLGSSNTSTESTCYQNGVQVDCAALPDYLQP